MRDEKEPFLAAGLALACLFLASAPTPAAGLPPGDPACDRAMPAYEPGWLTPARSKRLSLDLPGAGELLYLAARHTANPSDPQLGAFEREARRFRPTLILYEGDSRSVGDQRHDTVKRYGEAGFLRLLARELGVPARSFDATAADQIGFISSRFEPEEVKIYFVLREIWLLGDRQGRADTEIRELAGRIITGELLPELPRVLMSEKAFSRAFGQRWPPGVRWTRPKAGWFDPYRSARTSGGVFTNDLERAATVYRDLVMYRTIAHEVRRGERVFVVAGGGHLPVQEPALRCALAR